MKKYILLGSTLCMNVIWCQQPTEQSVKPAVKVGAFAAATNTAATKRMTPERPALPPVTENPQSPERPLSSLAKRNGSPVNKPQTPAASPFTPLDLAQPADVQTLGVPVSSAPASPQSKSTAAQIMELPIAQKPVGASPAAAAGAAARYQAPQHATVYVREDDEENPQENPRALARAEAAAEYRGSQRNLQIPVSPKPKSTEGSVGYAEHFVQGSASRSAMPVVSPREGNKGRASIRGSLNNGKSHGNGHPQVSGIGQGQLIASVPGHPEGIVYEGPALVEESAGVLQKKLEKVVLDKIEAELAREKKIDELKKSMIELVRNPTKAVKEGSKKVNKRPDQLLKEIFQGRYRKIILEYSHILPLPTNERTKDEIILWEEIVDAAAKQECCVIL